MKNKKREGCGLTPEERGAEFQDFFERFPAFLRAKKGAIGLNDQQLIACRLMQVHHWPLGQALAVPLADAPLCLPTDWQEFLSASDTIDIEYIRQWEDEHGFPIGPSGDHEVSH